MVNKFRHSVTHSLHRAEEWIFANPKIILSMILAVTMLFAMALPKLRVYSDFSDLLPQNHPYIKVYNRLKENFGGANMIIMAVEVEQGTIFNDQTLALIHHATQGVDSLPGVNHNLVSSLTHRTARKSYLDEQGGFASKAYYDPLKETRSVAELEQLKKDVIANPTMYGLLVSPDLKAALIKAQLNESDIDYKATFDALMKVRNDLSVPGHKIYVTGNPVLTGWVYTYVNQIVEILAWTLLLLAALLIVYFRRFYGIAPPLLGIALSAHADLLQVRVVDPHAVAVGNDQLRKRRLVLPAELSWRPQRHLAAGFFHRLPVGVVHGLDEFAVQALEVLGLFFEEGCCRGFCGADRQRWQEHRGESKRQDVLHGVS